MFSHVRRKYKKGVKGVTVREMCYSKWEKQLLQLIVGKFKRQQSNFSVI